MANFEDQLVELEKVVAELEAGELSLEQSVMLFERGVVLSKACKEQLEAAESRIQVLLQPTERGEVRVRELEVEEGFEDEEDVVDEEDEE